MSSEVTSGLNRLRHHLTYSNAMATLAVFIALGGTSYAVVTGSIGSREVKDNSIRGKDIRNRTLGHRDVKRNGLGGTNIRESRLGKVRAARNADRLGRLGVTDLRVHCPPGTRPAAAACVEGAARDAASYGPATATCHIESRRLATFEEVNSILRYSDISVPPEGHLTGTVVSPSSSDPERVNVLVVTNEANGATVVPATREGARPFRCALDPTN
jgi:hypothetical protein